MKKELLAIIATLLMTKANAGTVVKACAVAWPPYITINDGKFGGPDTEVIRKALSNLGYELEVKEFPWKRCLKMAENGQLDMVFSAALKPDRAEYLYYPKQPIHKTAYVFLTRKSEKHGWDASKDPTKLPQPIASVQGFSVTTELQAIKGVSVDTGAVSDQQNFQKFLAGRAPTMVIEKASAKNLLDKAPIEQKQEVVILDPPFSDERDYFVTVSKKAFGDGAKAQSFVDKLDQELVRMHKSGELAKFYN